MATIPHQFAAQREALFFSEANNGLFPVLQTAWQRTQKTLADISECLANVQLPECVETVAVSGSLGRMEQLPSSDCDLIIIVNEACQSVGDQKTVYDAIWNALAELEFARPKPEGIYGTCCQKSDLLKSTARGQFDEDVAVYGKRMQLLQDSQPVFGFRQFDLLVEELLVWYAGGNLAVEFPWRYLLNELMRYYRTLSVRYQWTRRDNPAEWLPLYAKYLHSRLIVYTGLLFVLAEIGSRPNGSDQLGALKQVLRLTPLERIAWEYSESGQSGIETVLKSYDTFLRLMSDREFVLSISESSNSNELENHPAYLEMVENSEPMRAELTCFVLSQQGWWSGEVMSGLFF